jgi:hypothetical protein
LEKTTKYFAIILVILYTIREHGSSEHLIRGTPTGRYRNG